MDKADVSNATSERGETSVSSNPDGQKQLECLIDTDAFSTLQFYFGEDNDTLGSSDNETSGVAYGSTLYAGGNINWQERIRAWFEAEFLGKLNYFLNCLSCVKFSFKKFIFF
jgi:hypothetical protein